LVLEKGRLRFNELLKGHLRIEWMGTFDEMLTGKHPFCKKMGTRRGLPGPSFRPCSKSPRFGGQDSGLIQSGFDLPSTPFHNFEFWNGTVKSTRGSDQTFETQISS
jgi:hypothetical protein